VKSEPGPAQTREIKALIYDLYAVMRKHGHLPSNMQMVGAFMLIAETTKALLSKYPSKRHEILEIYDKCVARTTKSIETGEALFQEEIEN
jgi:hypothetical protein